MWVCVQITSFWLKASLTSEIHLIDLLLHSADCDFSSKIYIKTKFGFLVIDNGLFIFLVSFLQWNNSIVSRQNCLLTSAVFILKIKFFFTKSSYSKIRKNRNILMGFIRHRSVLKGINVLIGYSKHPFRVHCWSSTCDKNLTLLRPYACKIKYPL